MKTRSAAGIACIWIGCVVLSIGSVSRGIAQSKEATGRAGASGPWMNASLDADTRADMMVHAMTIDEKIQLVHGIGWGVLRPGAVVPAGDNGGAGFVAGIPRLGLPDINLADSAVGGARCGAGQPVCDAAAERDWDGSKLGPGDGTSVWRGDWERAAG